MKFQGGLATYSPIKSIDGETLQLRSSDGEMFTFMLNAQTVYCQGDQKVFDWTYLKKIGKKISITVLTNNDSDMRALVVWDRGPSITMPHGSIVFALPPMCK
jgi:hypothetical protein